MNRRETTCGALQEIIFDQLDRLAAAQEPDEVEREIVRSNAVRGLAGVAIDNANTAIRARQIESEAMDASFRLPAAFFGGE